MIKVTNEVKVHDSEGKTLEPPYLSIQICSHWNRNEMVVLVTPDGAKLTVFARDLEAAIKNATNNVRH